MFDQLIGLLLLGLGIQSPVAPSVKGETTENVLTEQSSSSENTDHVREQARIKVLKDAAKKDREAYRVVLKNTKETFRATIEASRTAYKASLRGVRETFAQEVEAKREEAKAQVQSAREAFEKKLHEIRDERKQKLTEYIQNRLIELNTKRTDLMAVHLAKMSEILERILGKIEELKATDKDTVAVETAVTAADSAITAAAAAVAAQAGKSYVVAITTEANLKNAVESMRRNLATDLTATHQTVVTARKAVSTAIRELAKAKGETVPDAVVQ